MHCLILSSAIAPAIIARAAKAIMHLENLIYIPHKIIYKSSRALICEPTRVK
jgi:hypothetical protein